MDRESMIRKATDADISRVAEILIFAKRVAYRPIFRNDIVSFNEMQVLKLAVELQKEGALEDIVVYDDGIVKGMMKTTNSQDRDYENGLQLCEFYVDPFFQRDGIGSKMMKAVLEEAKSRRVNRIFLWVLEKNHTAIRFYEKNGFVYDGTKKLEEGTEEYILRYSKRL